MYCWKAANFNIQVSKMKNLHDEWSMCKFRFDAPLPCSRITLELNTCSTSHLSVWDVFWCRIIPNDVFRFFKISSFFIIFDDPWCVHWMLDFVFNFLPLKIWQSSIESSRHAVSREFFDNVNVLLEGSQFQHSSVKNEESWWWTVNVQISKKLSSPCTRITLELIPALRVTFLF